MIYLPCAMNELFQYVLKEVIVQINLSSGKRSVRSELEMNARERKKQQKLNCVRWAVMRHPDLDLTLSTISHSVASLRKIFLHLFQGESNIILVLVSCYRTESFKTTESFDQGINKISSTGRRSPRNQITIYRYRKTNGHGSFSIQYWYWLKWFIVNLRFSFLVW